MGVYFNAPARAPVSNRRESKNDSKDTWVGPFLSSGATADSSGFGAGVGGGGADEDEEDAVGAVVDEEEAVGAVATAPTTLMRLPCVTPKFVNSCALAPTRGHFI